MCDGLNINDVAISPVDSLYLGTDILGRKHWRIDITPRRRKFFRFCKIYNRNRSKTVFVESQCHFSCDCTAKCSVVEKSTNE